MKTEVLERYGIPKEVIKRWHTGGIRQLLPIQIQSITRFGILDGNSLIISGPGTSGKTFCGEMAALKTASIREKTVFLVPLKAIAIEKYKIFKNRYSPLGLNIRLSTRDHTDQEKDIIKNRFNILISIYEKFNSLTSKDITLIKSCRCFILDEFQMISDPERGMEIELIILKIKKFNPGAQIVILMGGGASADGISEWLNIPVLEETRRPVDLRLGVLFRGTFHFRGFNNHDEGDERWLQEREQIEESPVNPQIFSAIKLLAERGEQTIIFTSTKRNAVGLTRFLSKELNLKSAKNTIAGLDDLPLSVQNEILGECLFGGTAFHHAELDQDQRELVEAGFRSGEIRILVSTTTLAWGVNLPAKNVFIESMKYSGSRSFNCRDTLIPLSTVDFSQAAGRAGRIGYDRDYGRAVLTATSPFEQEILWENYIYGESSDIMSGLNEERLPEFMVRLISCRIIGSRSEINSALSDTFWSRSVEHDDISKTAEATLDFLKKGDLIQITTGDQIRVTKLGEILSSSGFSARSIIDIYEKSIENELSSILDWIYFSFGLIEWRDNCGYYVLNHVSSDDLYKRLNELSNGAFENSAYLASRFFDAKNGLINRRFIEMLFALEWISGRPTRDLERLFSRGSGGLRQDGSLLRWIISSISKALEINKNSADEAKTIAACLSALAIELKHGLPNEKIGIAKTLDLDREFVNRLYDFGINSVADIKNSDYTFLREILPSKILARVVKIINGPDKTEMKTSPYLSRDSGSDTIFTGKSRRLRKEIKIAGKSLFLQPRLYSYFQKLWWGIKSENPWVHKDSLEPGLNQAKYISKLRRVFRDNKLEIKIISDGGGHYRLFLSECENDAVVVGDD
ncbi:MAG: DEAD/DEAH box helicase [Candidatus Zixiibacteriota bacterium]|nr:MAG: DEAD/DEAH box helicase [candidate division Zixibacteria bacterium]